MSVDRAEASATPACRLCHRPEPSVVLSLGPMPLVNAYPAASERSAPEQRFPLELAFCPECSLVQILETVPKEQLFGHYLYFSSYSDTTLEHARRHARRLIEREALGSESMVVEVASNDGYLLQYFAAAGIPVLGVEPAVNIAAVAKERGVPTVARFFDRELAATLPQADVVIANNVLAHVEDLNGFVQGIRAVLKPDGLATLEVSYVAEMVERCEFDSIYHEHLCYFSVTALDALFSRNGLVLQRVERLPNHGGSLLLFVRHHAAERPTVEAMLRDERESGVTQEEHYRRMSERVERKRRALRGVLEALAREGQRIAAYGAAAKGTILLNAFGIGPELVEYVVDRSPHKQGRLMPGVHVPIVAPARLLEDAPDYVLILAWNLTDEIVRQQAEYLRRGGRFIVWQGESEVGVLPADRERPPRPA